MPGTSQDPQPRVQTSGALPDAPVCAYLSLAIGGYLDKLATSALTPQRRAQKQTKHGRSSDPPSAWRSRRQRPARP